MNPDHLSSLQLLSVAARAVGRESAAYLKTLGLPQLGLYILEYLDERSPMMQSELTRPVLVRSQTLGIVLTTLETSQWITRRRGFTHNQVAASITERGRALLVATPKRLRTLQLPTDIDALRPVLATIIYRAAQQPG